MALRGSIRTQIARPPRLRLHSTERALWRRPQETEPRPLATWLRPLIVMHRWLGIAGCLLFIAWFISGIAMMYVRMPTVTLEDRAWHAEPLNVASLSVAPLAAARQAGASITDGAELGMLLGRPVYRFDGSALRVVFADDGSSFNAVSADDAMRVAREWAPGSAASIRYRALLTRADQWTLQSRRHLPIHAIDVGDPAETRLYVSGRTGEVIVAATRSQRFWGYIGPVMHWLYLPVLRRNGPLWTQVILWTSGVGCVMCVLGLVIGLSRFSPHARFRASQGGARSPYTGLMQWHHYAGLLFGVVTFTWTFSGLMSMGPFDWLSDGPLPESVSKAISGQPAFDSIDAARVRAAVTAIGRDFAPKTLDLTAFRGEPYWMSDAASNGAVLHTRTRMQNALRTHRVVSALHPEAGTFARFDHAVIERVARTAMPNVPILDEAWLDSYDDYYLERTGQRSLPVLRVRYADANRTWIYFDPLRGSAALIMRRNERLNRWLYEGLHSLSWPALYFRRPLWDVVMILLLLGGLTLSVTTLLPGWRRLSRRTKGLVISSRRNVV